VYTDEAIHPLSVEPYHDLIEAGVLDADVSALSPVPRGAKALIEKSVGW